MDADPRVLVAGETLVDFIPNAREPLATVERFDRRPGGAPANVAVRLAQLDETPWFWTRVGADPFGDFLASALADREVPGRFVERDPDAKTSLAFVSGDPDATPRFTFYRDGTADTRLQPGRVPDEVLASVEWVVVGSVPLSSSPSRAAVHDLVRRAADRDCVVAFDVNARPELWTEADFRSEVRRLLPRADVVKASVDDLEHAGFTGEDVASPAGTADEDVASPAESADEGGAPIAGSGGDEAAAVARAVHQYGPHTVFLTRGADGAVAAATADAPWGPGEVTHPGYEVDAVDATGAGDAFLAGVVAALVDEADLDRALARGNAVAAASTTRAGGMAPLPDPERVR